MKEIKFLFLLVLFSFSIRAVGQDKGSFSAHVDPFIGTGGHGHTYPGATLPFGMVQLSPDTRLSGWDGCSGYHFSDTVIFGFSHTHLSGTGCLDYGDILIMPVSQKGQLTHHQYRSGFSKMPGNEIAGPGYYKVKLDNGIIAELTCTKRTGVHRYTFPEVSQPGIIIDLEHRDQVLDSRLKVVSGNEIEGMRISRSWAQKQIIYFVARFSQPFENYVIDSAGKNLRGISEAEGKSIVAGFFFHQEQKEPLIVKVGISAVSCENARRNLEAEVPGWNFNKVSDAAANEWNIELGKVIVDGGSPGQKVNFYTALYHAFLSPNLYSDVDGSYRGRDLKTHRSPGVDYYTVFSLWDTYRAAHPLFTITHQKKTTDFINTFLTQYKQGGILPVWELSSNETDCMIGYHAVPVITDAYVKGIRGFDAEKALEAMKTSAGQDRLGLKYYKKYGYIPGEKEGESVSKTLEYAYDDWCIAIMAKALGKSEDYRTYIRRGQSWKNIFDPEVKFMRPKFNGAWLSPFDPSEVNFNFTEANSWQYSFYVPQDLDGLMAFHGGKKNFALKLDSLFESDSKTTGREQADITGLIGQYAHGNEPSHHMAYLYNFSGEPWKTQRLVHKICKELYLNSNEGLCGNEDCGQMSAWYVLSALGFYPVTPGTTVYAIGTPMFPEATINLENKRQFRIIAKNLNEKNYFIQSAKLNGETYDKCFLEHSDIMNGGVLEFEMSDKPNKSWGTQPGDFPVSKISDDLITPVPFSNRVNSAFFDTLSFSLAVPADDAKIFYTLDGSEPTVNSSVFHSSITIEKSTTVKAFAVKSGFIPSYPVEILFNKIPKTRKINLLTKYSSQYPAAGELTLIDFQRGSDNFRTGTWQGYYGVNLDAIVDLGNVQEIHSLSAGFIQETGSWIFFPTEVSFFLSDDGNEFRKTGTVVCDIPESVQSSMIKDFKLSVSGQKARYVRIEAKNRGLCPPGHPGEGHKAWIFADEITID